MTEIGGNPGKGLSNYPEGADFAVLLQWHFDWGTRAKGSPARQGACWTRTELGEIVGITGGQPDRTVGYWLSGEVTPVIYYQVLEQVLFGDNPDYSEWRADFRRAFKIRRSAAQRTKPVAAVTDAERPPSRVSFLRAYNYEDAGVVSRSEVELKGPRDGLERSLFAQVDFFERLYVEGDHTRVEFGVARAILAVTACAGTSVTPARRLTQAAAFDQIRFLQSFKDTDFAISIEPQREAVSLGELSLPSEEGFNQLCRLATTPASVAGRDLRVEVHLRLNFEGIQLFDEALELNQKRESQLLAIIKAAATKGDRREHGLVVFPLKVTDEETTDLVVT